MTLNWSERFEPAGGPLRDCAYAAALTALVHGGKLDYPLGIYTVGEREALERSDNQPDETGANLNDVILAVKRRYGIDWETSGVALLDRFKGRSDVGFVITGANGNLVGGHSLRRWQPTFTGGHAVFIVPEGDKARWFDPLAPMRYAGDTADWATIRRWIGDAATLIAVREGAYAPPAPVTFTKAQLDAAVLKAANAAYNEGVGAVQAASAAVPRRNVS